MKKIQISPSILSADFSQLGNEIKRLEDAGADIITIHPEATDNLQDSIIKIRELKKKVGISLNPETKIEIIEKFLNQIDLVLIMSVNPGSVSYTHLTLPTICSV